jgi:hypothetical protein
LFRERNKMSRERDEAHATEITGSISELIRVSSPQLGNIVRWFCILESQFYLAHIKSDLSKYCTVIVILEDRHLDMIEDVISNPPTTGFYDYLKRALIDRLPDFDRRRVKKLLEAQDLGDRTSSQLFRDMKKLTNSAVSDDSLVTMWKNRLPANMRAILASTDIRDANKLMEMAEVNAASTSRTQCSTLPPSHRMEQPRGTYEARMARLERSIKELLTWTRNQQRRSRSTSRFRKPRP